MGAEDLRLLPASGRGPDAVLAVSSRSS